jgi:signal transduction histidine kinase
MKSIRRRVLIGALSTVIIALGSSGISIYLWFQANLQSAIDSRLRVEARSLAAMVEPRQRGKLLQYKVEIPPNWPDQCYRIRDMTGTLIAETTLAKDNHLLDLLPDSTPVTDVNGWRVGTWILEAGGEYWEKDQLIPKVIVTVGCSLDEMNVTLSQLAWILNGTLLIYLVLAGVVITIVLFRALRPLDQLANQLSKFHADTLDQRVAIPEERELASVAVRLNDLLSRLQSSFAREKAYNAAIAHELRTPIAGLLATAEVCTMFERDAATYRTAIQTCHRIGLQVRGLVDRLLLLAKLDAGQLSITIRPMALSVFLHEVWASYENVADERGLSVKWDEQAADRIASDNTALNMVMANLFDNAVSHADRASEIIIKTSDTAELTVISVSNRSVHATPDLAQHVFNRFWRGDAARGDTGRHCGLGLSLCHDLIATLKGRIEAKSNDGIFTVSLYLPKTDQ